ncbi:MAG: hypothetical protein WDM79_15545 [Terricaulis sp.]
MSAHGRHRPAAENFLRAAIDYPNVLARFGEWIDRLHIADPDLEAIRSALQALAAGEEGPKAIDRAALRLHLRLSGEDRAEARLSGWPKLRAADQAKTSKRNGWPW